MPAESQWVKHQANTSAAYQFRWSERRRTLSYSRFLCSLVFLLMLSLLRWNIENPNLNKNILHKIYQCRITKYSRSKALRLCQFICSPLIVWCLRQAHINRLTLLSEHIFSSQPHRSLTPLKRLCVSRHAYTNKTWINNVLIFFLSRLTLVRWRFQLRVLCVFLSSPLTLHHSA